MVSQEIKIIIAKYLSNQASNSELDQLDLWLKDTAHQKEFYYYVKANYAINFNLQKFNTELSERRLIAHINNDKKVIRINRYKNLLKYAVAASVLLFIIIAFVWDRGIKSEFIESEVVTVIEAGTDKATLTLEDGTEVLLEKGLSFKTNNANSNGESIVYKSGAVETNKIVYNYLTIPRGGQFFIKLTDGTQVWLNSETRIKYPVQFIDNTPRVVELIYGEAYFEVTKSKENSANPFLVKHNNQTIEVLGTAFNIKAYSNESNIYTTLAEGKIELAFNETKEILAPEEQVVYHIEYNTYSKQIVDIFNETSWKDGIFSFDDKSLKEIMMVLSRWYDINVVFDNQELEEMRFVGVLGKEQPVEEILNTLKGLNLLEDYSIKNKTVTLK